MSHRSIDKYLKQICYVVKNTILNVMDKDNLYCITVFGSAARPEDFVIDVSDVDVLVLTVGKPEKRFYSFVAYNSEVNVVILTINEFKKLVKIGDPLAFMLKYRVELYGKCVGNMLSNLRITEHTRRVLRRSIFAALGLALENYYVYNNTVKALSHLYHSIRHLVRYKVSLKGKFPISDKEAYTWCEYSQLKSLYLDLVEARKRRVNGEKFRSLVSKTVNIISYELKLHTTSINELEKVAAKGATIITAGESRDYIAFKVETLSSEGRKIFEVKNNEVREVDSIFF